MAERLQSGDPKAIEALYSMYFNRLYAFVFHSVKCNQAVAEDIVQNVFISAFRSAKNFKGKSRIYTWLVGIARHKITDYYRRAQRELYHNNGLANYDQFDLDSINDNSQSIADSLEANEPGLVTAALSALPLDYRQVLLFKYVDEMNVMEISQIMNRTPKAIDGLLTRARKLLKENISGKP